MRISTISRFKICRKLRLDIWGDVLYSSKRLRLFRKFKWWRVYPTRGRVRKRYGLSRRLFYVLKQQRTFVNWLRTSSNPLRRMRFGRRVSLASFIRRLRRSSKVNFAPMILARSDSFGSMLDSQDKRMYKRSFLRGITDLTSYRLRSPFLKRLKAWRRLRRKEERIVSSGYRSYLSKSARRQERLKMASLRSRITKNWPAQKQRRWRYFSHYSRLGYFHRKSTMFSPRLDLLFRVYANMFNELVLIRPTSPYSPQYSRFVRLQGPSWFFDNSDVFFRSFHRRFFSLKMYLNRISSKYVSTLYGHLSDFSSTSTYSRPNVTRCYIRRLSHSDRPSAGLFLGFGTMFKYKSRYVRDLWSAKHRFLYEVHRNDYLRDLRMSRRLLTRSFFLVLNNRSLKRRFKLCLQKIRFNKVTSGRVMRPSRERVRPFNKLKLKRKSRGGRHFMRRNSRGGSMAPRRRRVFKPSRFTNKDYMNILLNRSRRTRSKRKSLHHFGLIEKNKLRFFYGFISERAFRAAYKYYQKFQDDFFFRFLRSLESRLFMVLVRSGFFSTAKLAKQLILHSRIRVNGLLITDFNYLIRRGDIITFDLKDTIFFCKSFGISRANRKLIPRSNLVVSYKLPAIIVSGNLKGPHQVHFRFRPNARLLNRFYKA